MNFTKLLAIMDLFRKGESVANKEAWKTGQITVTAVAGVILALANIAVAYGWEMPAGLNTDTITALASGTIGFVNLVLTYITSEKVGILPAKVDQK